MKNMTNKAVFVAVAVFVIAGVGATHAELGFNATVSDVTMIQRENSRFVDIGYTLTGEDVIVTLSIETNGVAIPDSAVTRLSGDVSTVIKSGTGKSIVWNAGADWPEHAVTNARARVTAWSTNAPPQYCAVDVFGGTAAESYPVYYYVSAGAVPDGVTNNIYKTTRILMRKLPPTGPTGFKMGSNQDELGRQADRETQHYVVLNKPFYAGVYQITQEQWHQVMGTWPSWFKNNDYKRTRPVEKVSYDDIRGTAVQGGAGWPMDDNVYAQSFMGRLRIKAELAGFDLPTDAQWEYACRAGKDGALNDGTLNITNENTDARMNLLGRYKFNGGYIGGEIEPQEYCTTSDGPAAVGSYLPNAWGLYDMHGNVYEWCLDWFSHDLGTSLVEDPKGATSDIYRMIRGGSWSLPVSVCRSAYRGRLQQAVTRENAGFRLVRNLP